MFALWSGLGLWRVEGRSSQARDGGDPPHQQGDSGSGLSPGARREPHATSSLAPALALVEFPTRLFPADFLLTQKAVLPSWPIPGFWGLPAERATGRAPRESSARPPGWVGGSTGSQLPPAEYFLVFGGFCWSLVWLFPERALFLLGRGSDLHSR